MCTPTNLEATCAVLASERHLDEPVGEYRPLIIGASLELGTASALKEFYKQNLLDVPGRIVVGKTELTTEPEVTAILRALLYTGCCRIEERSDACRDIFIRACKAGKHIGIPELLESFEEAPTNPFVGVLQRAITELVGDAK